MTNMPKVPKLKKIESQNPKPKPEKLIPHKPKEKKHKTQVKKSKDIVNNTG
jgi:hypothetical protein